MKNEKVYIPDLPTLRILAQFEDKHFGPKELSGPKKSVTMVIPQSLLTLSHLCGGAPTSTYQYPETPKYLKALSVVNTGELTGDYGTRKLLPMPEHEYREILELFRGDQSDLVNLLGEKFLFAAAKKTAANLAREHIYKNTPDKREPQAYEVTAAQKDVVIITESANIELQAFAAGYQCWNSHTTTFISLSWNTPVKTPDLPPSTLDDSAIV